MDPHVRGMAAQYLDVDLNDDIQIQKNILDALVINSKNENIHVRDACILESDKKCLPIADNLLDSVSHSSSRNINHLQELLFNPEITVIQRAKTVIYLSFLATKRAAAILGSALAKNEQYMTIPIQQLILPCLRNFKDPIASKELCKIISNTNIIPCVRYEAVRILHCIDRNCGKFLGSFKRDKSQDVRDIVTIALFGLSK